ncbi:hypothetical protein E2C01_090357 [Portunus trituberculatus]|uniref:Uncharacterized protein n=1 Tax=Portunus trituberculatus TaxID=210409 RepID=A0A5B7JEH7_PORTR|nr:hypothetical protein [Portunus trituberculatus]
MRGWGAPQGRRRCDLALREEKRDTSARVRLMKTSGSDPTIHRLTPRAECLQSLTAYPPLLTSVGPLSDRLID